jgi:hypothetical protein
MQSTLANPAQHHVASDFMKLPGDQAKEGDTTTGMPL